MLKINFTCYFARIISNLIVIIVLMEETKLWKSMLGELTFWKRIFLDKRITNALSLLGLFEVACSMVLSPTWEWYLEVMTLATCRWKRYCWWNLYGCSWLHEGFCKEEYKCNEYFACLCSAILLHLWKHPLLHWGVHQIYHTQYPWCRTCKIGCGTTIGFSNFHRTTLLVTRSDKVQVLLIGFCWTSCMVLCWLSCQKDVCQW